MEAYSPLFKEEPEDDENGDLNYVNVDVDPLSFLPEEEDSFESGQDDEQVQNNGRKRSKSVRNTEEVKAKNKIRQARRRLRIKLSKSGASPEQIEREVQKLETSYKASPPVSVPTQRRTHERIKEMNRIRQAKRRLRIKLRESGASHEKIEREIANLFGGTTEEFEVESTPNFAPLPPYSNFFIKTEQEDDQNEDNLFQQNLSSQFFPTPPAEPFAEDDDEEEVEMEKLRTENVHVGSAKSVNLANEASSEDEYEEQSSSSFDVDPKTNEKRRKKAEYMKKYRRRLRQLRNNAGLQVRSDLEGETPQDAIQIKQEPVHDIVKIEDESWNDERLNVIRPVLNTFAKQQQQLFQERRERKSNFMREYRRKQREKADKERMSLLEQKVKKEQEEDNRREKINQTRKSRQKQTHLMESSEDKLQEKRRKKTEYMRNYRNKKRSVPSPVPAKEDFVPLLNKKSSYSPSNAVYMREYRERKRKLQTEPQPCSSSSNNNLVKKNDGNPKSRASYMREWRKLKKLKATSQSSSVRRPIVVRVIMEDNSLL